MALPSWLLEPNATKRVGPIPHGIAGSRWTAPGWRLVGQDHYTAIPVPGYEGDPDILRAIHVFDPGAVPIWRKQLWLTPGKNDQTALFVHHALARWVEYPRAYALRLKRLELPNDWRGPVPNVIDVVLENSDCDRVLRHGGPGIDIAWDDWLEKFCRRAWEEVSLKRFDSAMKALQAKRKAEAVKEWRSLEERRIDLDDWIVRQREQGRLSRDNWLEYEHKRKQIIVGKSRVMAFLNGGSGPTLDQEAMA